MTRIIVTTGPESSGKTTLSQDLASSLVCPLVTEASRDYLTEFYRQQAGSAYTSSDLLAIAHAQEAREHEALADKPALLVCDTDLLVVIVWSEVKYGRCEPCILERFTASLQQQPRYYLLCDPEIPWIDDPLRENPQDRDYLLSLYMQKLRKYNLPWLHVRGNENTRTGAALDFLKKQQRLESIRASGV